MAHRHAWRDTEEQLKQSRQQIERQQEKIEALKYRLRGLQSAIGLKQSDSSLSTETGRSFLPQIFSVLFTFGKVWLHASKTWSASCWIF